ncbi:MAG: hypothetical protein QOE24_2665 [Frankiales bacterium]|jgi:hypothetical protein|nr:hypothetical protein [Frankiales bacterium]
MMQTQLVKPRQRGPQKPSTFEAVRAEALFMSSLQSSESPAPDQVCRAVATTIRRLGIRGCTAAMAREFGDHPDTAPARMTWALATIRTTYPRRQARRILGEHRLSRPAARP